MRLASNGVICVDGRINQPLIGKGIDLYQSRLIDYFAMLRLRQDLERGDDRLEAHSEFQVQDSVVRQDS
ncbi:MAG: hypothetical protein RLZ98_176 [Pseudomonadota bacterium]|jgi:hypothetical protein